MLQTLWLLQVARLLSDILLQGLFMSMLSAFSAFSFSAFHGGQLL